MARTTELKCDVCKKSTARIVGKLHWIPATGKLVHSNYTHHADVGECCGGKTGGGSDNKLLRLFNFRKRETAEQYRERRRNGN